MYRNLSFTTLNRFRLYSLVLLLLFSISFVLTGQNNRVDGASTDSLVVGAINSSEGKPGTVSRRVRKKDLDWNQFDFGFMTFRLGGGFIYDFATHAPDAILEQQMDSIGTALEPTGQVRDFRVLGSGKFNTKRPLSYKFAYMYDGVTEEWLVRETGLMIGLPELSSQVFIGRSKEGMSMPKIMNGHSPWGVERSMVMDMIPILADGIKWYGYLPKSGILWNLAAFNDVLSHEQKFSTFAWQYLARVGWMHNFDEEHNRLVHLAGYYRIGKPENEKFRARSRPESNPSPYFIDTEEFDADRSNHYGFEAYYSHGRWMTGAEYYVHNFSYQGANTRTFAGGDLMFSYFFTGESRPYNTTGNIYNFVPIKKPVGKGGFGAWEGVLRLSTMELNSGPIQGGSLFRITPMINWYVIRSIRIEFVYGYAILDRYGLKGSTQIFQSRIQYTLF